MGKEERKQKIEELSKKMKEVNLKIKEGTDTVIVAGMEAKDVFGKILFAKIFFAINVSSFFWTNLFNGLAP